MLISDLSKIIYYCIRVTGLEEEIKKSEYSIHRMRSKGVLHVIEHS